MEARSRSFLVWGAGGHGRVVGDLVRAAGHELSGYIDSDRAKLSASVGGVGVSVSRWEEEFLACVRDTGRYPPPIDACALGIGSNQRRQECLITLAGLDVPALVHPSASVSPSAQIGRGTVIFPHAVVNAGAWIGEGVIVNTGGIIEHDCVVDSAVHVSPGAVLCGGVRIGERSWIGAGTIVIQGVTVGKDATAGAGSTVIEDVYDGDTVIGSPARNRKLQDVKRSM